MTPGEHQILKEPFWDKNKRLQRPLSPHLTIYKFQMTSMLSITHRGTGLAQSAILSGAAIWAIATNTSFPALLTSVQALGFGGALIFLGKFAIAWPVTYHLFNGLRHLVSWFSTFFSRSSWPFGVWRVHGTFRQIVVDEFEVKNRPQNSKQNKSHLICISGMGHGLWLQNGRFIQDGLECFGFVCHYCSDALTDVKTPWFWNQKNIFNRRIVLSVLPFAPLVPNSAALCTQWKILATFFQLFWNQIS